MQFDQAPPLFLPPRFSYQITSHFNPSPPHKIRLLPSQSHHQFSHVLPSMKPGTSFHLSPKPHFKFGSKVAGLLLHDWQLPWHLNSSKYYLQLEPNLGAWNGLLFLDNPIGTGFSIASSPKEIPIDQYSVASHLFTAISSFFELDPSFRSRSSYVMGGSYAGRYVPAIGYYISEKKNAPLPVTAREFEGCCYRKCAHRCSETSGYSCCKCLFFRIDQ